ncbi:MAG: hypothetical protein JWN40_2523 [Phycisphaerales bacterium]|nr:hypothetical protein [Phycisphaerales bacterium]
MVLSKRERYIAVGAISVVTLLAVYYVLINPLLDRMKDLDNKVADRNQELKRAERLIEDSKRLGPVLAQRIAGPLKKNQSEAESQMLKSIADWARDARLTPPSIDKPDRIEKEKEFSRMTFRASGAGGMAQIGNFLWRLHTSTVPVRISEMTLATHKEGSDELTIQLGISTIFLATDTDKSGRPAAPAVAPADAPKEATP